MASATRDRDAQRALAVFLTDGSEEHKREGLAVLQALADAGDAKSINTLGYCCLNGIGTAKDEVKAVEYFRRSALAGCKTGQFNFATCLAKGCGVAKAEAEAFSWFKNSADQGHAAAQCWLGLRFANGVGVEKDSKQAVLWYQRSASQGNADALVQLGVHWSMDTA